MPQGDTVGQALESSLETDIVILAMGPTKAGRSTFLNHLAGSDVFEVSTRLASCTQTVSSYVLDQAPPDCAELNRALNGRRIVLVDTPGYDATGLKDESVALIQISDWLEKSYRQGIVVAGIVYLHDITRDDFSRPLRLDLSLFSKLCGDQAMKKVAFVTTKWERLQNITEGLERAAMLKSDCWANELRYGASVFRMQSPDGSGNNVGQKRPWEIVHHLVLKGDIDKGALQIQDEIVNRGRSLQDTAAGQVLRRFFALCRKLAKWLMGRSLDGGNRELKVNFSFQGTDSDIVLFVIGGVGVGKSTFINYILDGISHTGDTRPKVHENLSACTLSIDPIRVKPNGSQGDMGRVVLVDGPGLDGNLQPKKNARRELMVNIKDWFYSHYPSSHIQRGIVYVHDIAQAMSEGSRTISFLDLQAAIYLSSIIQSGDIQLVTMKWGKRQSDSQDHQAEIWLKKQPLFKHMIDAGYPMRRIEQGREGETAISAIRYFLEGVGPQREGLIAAKYKKLLESKVVPPWK